MGNGMPESPVSGLGDPGEKADLGLICHSHTQFLALTASLWLLITAYDYRPLCTSGDTLATPLAVLVSV